MKKILLTLVCLMSVGSTLSAQSNLSQRLVPIAKKWDRPSINSNSVDLLLKRYGKFRVYVTPGRLYIYGLPGERFVTSIEEGALKSAGVGLSQGASLGEGDLIDLTAGTAVDPQAFVFALREAARTIDAQEAASKNDVK